MLLYGVFTTGGIVASFVYSDQATKFGDTNYRGCYELIQIELPDILLVKPDPRNTGHGIVTPRPDGIKAKCLGPGSCDVCNKEYVEKYSKKIEAIKIYCNGVQADFPHATAWIDNIMQILEIRNQTDELLENDQKTIGL